MLLSMGWEKSSASMPSGRYSLAASLGKELPSCFFLFPMMRLRNETPFLFKIGCQHGLSLALTFVMTSAI